MIRLEKGLMKKWILALVLCGLFAGCASNDQDRGGSNDQYFNNATHGTGTSTATNSGISGDQMPP
jgi:uncharacterized lipoprotein